MPCTSTPSRAASSAPIPCASSAPMIPVKTSPAPAVPSAGFAVGLMNTVPSGLAVSVRAPFSTTTARVSAASRRADATRAC